MIIHKVSDDFAIYKNGKIAKLSKNVPIWFEREIKENHRKI